MQPKPARGRVDSILFAAFPLVLLAERFSHFATRAVLRPYLLGPPEVGGLDRSRTAADHVYGLFSNGVAIAPVLALAVAVILGPRVAAAVGLLLIAGSQLLLSTARVDLLYPFVVLHVAGVGLFLPSWFVLAASAHPYEQTARRAVTFVGLYLMLLLGAILGPAFAAWTARAAGPPVAFAVTAALDLVAAAGALVAIAVPGRWRDSTDERPGLVAAPWVAVLVAGAVVYWTSTFPAAGLASRAGLDRFDLDAAQRLQVFVFRGSSLWISAIAWIGFTGLVRSGLSVRPGRLLAFGLAAAATAAAIGAALLGTGVHGSAAVVGLGLGLVAGGVAEALFVPLGLASAASAARPRLALVYVVAWLAAAHAAQAAVLPALSRIGAGNATSLALLAAVTLLAAVAVDRALP